MSSYPPRGYQNRLLQLLSFAILNVTLISVAQADRSWDEPNDGNWSDPSHWSPFGVPSPADIARLGNLPGIEEFAVSLDQNDTISGLVITNRMRLNTDGNTLFVNGATTMDGGAGFFTNDSRLNILQGSIVTTQDLTLINGGSVFLDDGRYDITGTATIDADSAIFGDNSSTIRLFAASSPSLVNDGEILGRFDGGLVIDQVSTGRIDLDGNSGNGKVLVDRSNIPGTLHSTLTINGDQLHDDFNGLMRIAQGGTANMNLVDGWTMGAGSMLIFAGDPLELNELNGSEVTLSSEVRSQLQSLAQINADAILTNTVNVDIFEEGTLGFHGETHIDGGQFTLDEDATLDFVGPTTVRGGVFSTFSNLSSDGSVNFNGPTEWDGIATFNGIVRQNGDASVSGSSTINAGVLDMDGNGGTTWNIGNSLAINAEGVDSTISNSFDGTINIGGGFFPKLTLNLDDPTDHWTMAGEMNLSGLAVVPFSITRVSGSHMRITGDVNVSNRVGISAPTTFDNGSETNFDSATTTLRMDGETVIRSGAAFNGQGTLANTADEGLTLEDGVSLDEVGLINGGLLEVGNSPGVAAVDRFENTADGSWLVEIGGHVAGTEHDLLLVTDGMTQLDGLIEVELIDAGAGLFLPEIGDEFTVLTSFGNVSGTFLNDPVSFAAGQQFHWGVEHHPNDVTLVLLDITGIVPEPTTLLLAALGLACCCMMRSSAHTLKPLSMLAVACVLSAAPAYAVDYEWTATENGFWATPTNWSPNGMPGAGDTVYMGNLPAIENSDVALNNDEFASEVHISDGMTLGTQGHQMTVLGDTIISGLNVVSSGNATTYHHSRIFVRRGVGTDDYDTDNLIVTDEGRVRLYDGGILEVDETLSVDSTSSVVGHGVINFVDSGEVYDNNGVLEPFQDGLVLNALGGGMFDLDGSTGSGSLLLEYQFRDLTINGGTLADSFSGEILIDGDAALQMNLDAPWEADVNSEIRFGYNNNGISPGPAVLGGVGVTISGFAQAPYGTHGRIDAAVTYATTANVEVLDTARLEMNGSITIDGGQFLVGEDGVLDFDGETTVGGGTFTTFSNLSSDGSVNFNGPTEWDGIATFNGIVRQNGDASVSDASTINAGVLDMDGNGGTTWSIGNSLAINAVGVDSTISNSFDGTINIGGGFFPKLTLNLDDPTDHWTMAGEMNLANLGFVPFSISRVAGSPMRLTGELNVSNLVGISSDTTFDNSSITNLASPTTQLSLHGQSRIRSGATFNGQGALANTSDEGLTLEDGVSLDEVGLINDGLLEVGNSPGVAAVDRFENTADGSWLVEIGGHVAGTEHDLLLVTDGMTQLDGLIEVELIDAGTGLFLPEIGDEFTVLTSFGNVSGTFLNDPVSFAAGQQFHWGVEHHPNDVTLVLLDITGIVPEPTTHALVLAAALFLSCGRSKPFIKRIP